MTDRVIDTSRAASARPGDALGDALDAMRSAGIEPILMRDRADDIARLDELDLLVPRNAVAPAIATLRQHGWALMQGGAIAPCKRTLGLLVDGRLLAIDLHYALVQNGLVYGDADWFAAAAVGTASDARQPRPEALLYHLIMHVVLGKDSLADKHRPLMDGVLADNPDRAAILAQAERFGLRALMAGVLDDPIGVLSDLARVARLRRRAVAALIVARPANLVRLLARRCAIRLGPLIAISVGSARIRPTY